MARLILQRLLVSLIRFGGAILVLLVLVEFAYCVLGGSGNHVWLYDSYGPVPPELTSRPVNWAGLFFDRLAATLPVAGLAFGGILLIGYSWGVMGARLRRFHLARILSAPFSAFACIPGFWFVVLVAIYSYFSWQRPGFANDLIVEDGPNLLAWWHAAVIALPAMALGAAWQIREVSGVLEREVALPYVKGLHLAGYSDEDIFYGNAFRRAVPLLISVSDRTLSSVVGSLICLEYAFRFPGSGALLVESVKLQSYAGIFVSALSLSLIVSVGVLLRDWILKLVQPE
ncbi:MAG: ABC transporter permease subunit [Verrucomicrobiales bacterium]|jgi:peptide/nickel transport system permease protein|nr:ABC transporter permease subunit [Verrucomicrobiales bacterium]